MARLGTAHKLCMACVLVAAGMPSPAGGIAVRRPACPRAAPLDRRKLQERQGCSSALALRGGGHTDDEAESDAESATFSDVVLLGFDESAVMWRQRGRGALHLLNLASGEPRLTFSATSTVPNGGTEAGVPNLSHALWEMLDFQPLTVEPSARSLAYELPAELMSSTAACPPKHDIMVGWRFATAEAAHLFEQALLKVQARLRCERHGGLVRERRSAGSDSPDMVSIMAGQQNRAKRWRPLHKSQGWVKTREHGLSAQHLHDMLHMNTETVVFHDEAEETEEAAAGESVSEGPKNPFPRPKHFDAGSNHELADSDCESAHSEESWSSGGGAGGDEQFASSGVGTGVAGDEPGPESSDKTGNFSESERPYRATQTLPAFDVVGDGKYQVRSISGACDAAGGHDGGEVLASVAAGGLEAAALKRLGQLLAEKTNESMQVQQQDGVLPPLFPLPARRRQELGERMGLRGGVQSESNGNALRVEEKHGEQGGEGYLLTTAIAYTNGVPHIGHAYEAVTSDVIARHHRLRDKEVYFLTGSDEHGQKIAAAALAAGETPQVMCDRIVGNFEALYAQLSISHDGFIRTTSRAHKAVAQEVFRRAYAAGDIYLGNYSGWYNVRLESFVPEAEAEQTNFTDALTGAGLQRVEEASYFFRLSNYQQRLKQHIQAHPDFIQPLAARNEILQRLEEPLRDLSVSRTSFEWGVAVPDDHAGNHVMYVWFDALTNYLSGSRNELAARAGGAAAAAHGAGWPAALQVVGKDIVWFHAVIWPAMLWSIGEQPPRRIFAHGFVTDGDGRKMSKSLGNVVEPGALLERYGTDAVRYALVCAAPWGHDVPFSESNLVSLHNTVLADGLGNLVHRALSLCKRFCAGRVPDAPSQSPAEGGPIDVHELLAETAEAFESLALLRAAQVAERAVRQTNKYLTDSAPWKASPEAAARRPQIIRTVLEALYVIAHLFLPFTPRGAERLLGALAHPTRALTSLQMLPLACLTPATALAGAASAAASESSAAPFQVLFNRLAAPHPQDAQGGVGVGVSVDIAGRMPGVGAFPLDLRAARVLAVETAHEDLRLVTVALDDTGGQRRTVVARLPEEAIVGMQGKVVVVLINVVPARIGGVDSEALLLVAHQSRPQKMTCILEVAGAAGTETVSAPALTDMDSAPQAACVIGSRIRPAGAAGNGGVQMPDADKKELVPFDVSALKKLPLRVQQGQDGAEKGGSSCGGLVVFEGHALQTEEGLAVVSPAVSGPSVRIR